MGREITEVEGRTVGIGGEKKIRREKMADTIRITGTCNARKFCRIRLKKSETKNPDRFRDIYRKRDLNYNIKQSNIP